MAAGDFCRDAGEVTVDTKFSTVRQQIDACLAAERQRIHQEIKEYPRPVAGCDQQFNYLLEQRSHIAHEISHLEDLCGEPEVACSIAQIRDFINSSQCLSDHAKRNMLSLLSEEPRIGQG